MVSYNPQTIDHDLQYCFLSPRSLLATVGSAILPGEVELKCFLDNPASPTRVHTSFFSPLFSVNTERKVGWVRGCVALYRENSSAPVSFLEESLDVRVVPNHVLQVGVAGQAIPFFNSRSVVTVSLQKKGDSVRPSYRRVNNSGHVWPLHYVMFAGSCLPSSVFLSDRGLV
ncbi:MAG TPA: hypothetical protein VJB87_01350 [Candidatus Nanoarchaeia archaeon]|nr:hypothetical protein [Candidatus Nanoarchaeia archaeon]